MIWCPLSDLQNVLRKRDQSQAEYEGRLEAAILRKQEDRTPVSVVSSHSAVSAFAISGSVFMFAWHS